MARRSDRNATRMDARFIAVVVGLAAVLFIAIQVVPLLDGGHPAGPMPAIEVEDVPIRSAAATEGTAVELRVEACTGQLMVGEVSESDTKVRVRVLAEVGSDRDACPTAVRVQLEQPLGERDIVDLSTGRRVEQSPAPGPDPQP